MLLWNLYFLCLPQCSSRLTSCDYFQHLTVIILRSSLSSCAISPVPHIPGNPGSCKYPPQAGLLQHQQDPGTYLQLQLPHQLISSTRCPMLRTSCVRQCAALSCHAFPIWIHFYFQPQQNCEGKKNSAFTVFLKIFFFCLSPAMQGVCWVTDVLLNILYTSSVYAQLCRN